ncbi:DNA polymerase III subunit gamma/tau [Spiroplasma endosymbiont of 'Nebria riversi']|uniref:DNA polymerase III subunit gamma/tau n=1 Tax=Spiroplasma endosymbiont of 'Nebria riversi' TaxID=2792084 RepID=UPI001C0433CE|nr:DNA polymerase III subunit gamma/tau [Spiroplasma endosymbiont of 'Nebria riversi']
MKYLTLYRKYRPNKFSKIIGQNQIVTSLQNAIINDKFSHAYLLCGPRGVGKTSIAKVFAKTVNCLKIINGEACNECYICESFNNNSCLDLLEIDGASNNGVDEIRELKEKISLLPSLCKYKVYIIDEVHMLTISAFNALLKTLEEPPRHAIFILATTEVYKIPLTIVSRCQKFDFKLVNKNNLVQNLITVLEQEQIPYEKDGLEQIALLSSGAVRDSLSILEQVIAYNREVVNLASVNMLFMIPSKAEKIAFLLDIINNKTLKVLQTINNFLQVGVDINNLTIDLINICKEIIIYKGTTNKEILMILDPDDSLPFSILTQEQLLKIIENYLEALNNYRFSNNAIMYFEIASFKNMNYFQNMASIVTTEVSHPDEIITTVESQQVDNKKESLTLNDSELSVVIDDLKSETNKIIIPQNDSENQDENVSETNNISVINKPFIWEMTEYLNVLSQADKYLRTEYSNRWNLVNEYLTNSSFHKIAKMLVDTTIVAAMKGAIILSCPIERQATIINNYSFTKNMQEFLKDILLTKNLIIMAVHTPELAYIRQEYYQLRIANKLPTPYALNFKDYYRQEEDIILKEKLLDNSVYQTVQELFDNIILID